MQANLELGRAHTQFGNAEKKVKNLEQDIQDEIKERNATVKMYAELEAKYKVAKRGNRGKVTVKTRDVVRLVNGTENLTLGQMYRFDGDGKLIPITSLHSNFKDERLTLDSTIKFGEQEPLWEFDYSLDMKLQVKFAETHLPSGGINHYATVWEVDSKGNKLGELELDKFEVVVEKPESKRFFKWAPHIDAGVLLGAALTPPDFLGPSGS